ncbi:MAG TPA: hypothetical protein VFV92_12830 [Candidatus Bathyarchaeia archaeon]|nr:hypothetical protein [Candidatus Bathyarchaeia archaeon]
MERRDLPDPLRPRPIEPLPPLRRPETYMGPQEELGRILKEILDRLNGIETRLRKIEETLKAAK